MSQWLTAPWYAERARPSLLTPLSWLYGGVVALRRRAYAAGWLTSVRVPQVVIIVGNLTVGGSGKTPLTLYLVEALRAQGLKVGILSRGYGRSGSAALVVSADSDWCAVGDEPLLLARRSGAPTVVARDRVAGARLLGELGAQVIVCDDGLQHLRLARDLQIVVIDGTRGFGNGRLLPAGPLREPAARLAAADLVVLNGAARHASLAALPGGAPLLNMQLRAGLAQSLGGEGARGLASFAGSPVHAVAGIGSPARFFATLRAAGLELIEHPFPDHHPLTPAELDFGDSLPVLMTEKDAVKCTGFARAGLWYVPVAAHLSDADAQQLLRCVQDRVRAVATQSRSG